MKSFSSTTDSSYLSTQKSPTLTISSLPRLQRVMSETLASRVYPGGQCPAAISRTACTSFTPSLVIVSSKVTCLAAMTRSSTYPQAHARAMPAKKPITSFLFNRL